VNALKARLLSMREERAILSLVMAGLVPAIHVFDAKKTRRGCPAAQTSLRSLRKLDCVAGHDE
jgi:hypothetical protein